MLISKQSRLTGKFNQMNLPITPIQYAMFLEDKQANLNIHFPKLSHEQRNFLMSGMTPNEFLSSLGV